MPVQLMWPIATSKRDATNFRAAAAAAVLQAAAQVAALQMQTRHPASAALGT
jgi:hypothetical protein